MNSFFRASRLPGIIGAVDCTHIPIQSPGADDAEMYRNRKGYFSVNVQLVCDNTGYITDVVARWPGSVHDSTIFDNSHVRALLETQQFDGYLVGDSGYACRRYLLTPVNNPTNRSEVAYNNAHVSARNCIDRVNGVLKRRFPALKYGMRLRIDHVLPVIVTTTVLHNIAAALGEEVPPDDQQLDSYISLLRQQGLALQYDPVDVLPPPMHANGNGNGATFMRQSVIQNNFA